MDMIGAVIPIPSMVSIGEMFVIYIKALTKVGIVKFIYAKIVLKIILLCKPILPNALINRFTVLWQIFASERHGQNWSRSSMN